MRKKIVTYIFAALLSISIAIPSYADEITEPVQVEEGQENQEAGEGAETETEAAAQETEATPDTEEPQQNETEAAQIIQNEHVVRLVMAFRFSDGSIDVWNTGSGIAINDKTIVTATTVAFTSDEDTVYQARAKEKQDFYARLGIDLGDFYSVKDSFLVYVSAANDVTTTATIQYDNENGLVLLQAKDSLGITELSMSDSWTEGMSLIGYTTDSLSDMSNAVQDEKEYNSAGQQIYDTLFAPENNILTLGENTSLGMNGAGLFSSEHTLAGIVVSVSQNNLTVVPASEVDTFVNVDPEEERASAEMQEKIANELDRLETAVNRAKNYDTSSFTEESVNRYLTAITNAEDILTKLDPTLQEIEDAGNELNDAKDALEEPEAEEPQPTVNMTKVYILIGCILGVIAGFIIVILAILKLISTKKKPAAETSTEKEYISMEVEPEPKKKKNKIDIYKIMGVKKKEDKKDQAYGGEYARATSNEEENEEGDAGTSVLDNGMAETSVLSKHAMIKAYLTNAAGERIDITKADFVIGKRRVDTNYTINNPSVSRNHCVIHVTEDACSIEDLASLNGTSRNGIKLEPHAPEKLSDGDVLLLADTTLQFHIDQE